MSKIIGYDSLSENMISTTIDKFCDNIDILKTTTKIGKGAQGAVYEWCLSENNCNFVVKINEIESDKITKLTIAWEEEQQTSGILSQYNLSPQIYAMRYCPQDKILITLMDKVQGNTVNYYMNEGRFKNSDMKLLIEYIGKIHNLGLYHGDLNPGNIFYDKNNKKFKFIDITYRRVWKQYYDYLTIMYYFPFFFASQRNIPLFLTFLEDLMSAVNDEMDKLEIARDDCVEPVKKIIRRMRLFVDDNDNKLSEILVLNSFYQQLGEISTIVEDKIYFHSKRCQIVTK